MQKLTTPEVQALEILIDLIEANALLRKSRYYEASAMMRSLGSKAACLKSLPITKMAAQVLDAIGIELSKWNSQLLISNQQMKN